MLKKYFCNELIGYFSLLLLVIISFSFNQSAKGYILKDEMVPLSTGGFINVRDYGAKGDGITNDSMAFQRAIDDASLHRMKLLIPPSDNLYLINHRLRLRNNTYISGYGATLFMPSEATVRNLLWSSARDFISNVTIEGLILKSVNDRAVEGHHTNILTSNVQGMYFMGIDNLTIRDVQMYNMQVGFKLGWALNGEMNRNVKIENLEVYNARTPLLIHSTDGFVITDSILDASAGVSRFDHSAYISGDSSNLYFNNVKFINSPGGGLHIYNGYADKNPARNVTVENCSFENLRTGIYIYSGAENITILNSSIYKTGLAFNINNASKLNISNIYISEAAQKNSESIIFLIINNYQSKISGVTIDVKNIIGSVFALRGEVDGLTISEVNVTNINNDVGFFFTPPNSLIKNLVVENSTFEWSIITNPRISLRGPGSSAVFRNNTFINNSTYRPSLSNNFAGTSVLLENNSYSGFARLSHTRDHARLSNNIDLSARLPASN